jgi:hypothetical protein
VPVSPQHGGCRPPLPGYASPSTHVGGGVSFYPRPAAPSRAGISAGFSPNRSIPRYRFVPPFGSRGETRANSREGICRLVAARVLGLGWRAYVRVRENVASDWRRSHEES